MPESIEEICHPPMYLQSQAGCISSCDLQLEVFYLHLKRVSPYLPPLSGNTFRRSQLPRMIPRGTVSWRLMPVLRLAAQLLLQRLWPTRRTARIRPILCIQECNARSESNTGRCRTFFALLEHPHTHPDCCMVLHRTRYIARRPAHTPTAACYFIVPGTLLEDPHTHRLLHGTSSYPVHC